MSENQDLVRRLAETVELDDEGRVVICFGVLLTVYFHDGWRRDRREAVLSCFEEFEPRFRSRLNWWVKEGGHPSPTAKLRSRSMAPYLLSNRLGSPDSAMNWAFRWHGGRTPADASPIRIEGFGASAVDCRNLDALSYLSAVVPMPEKPSEFDELVALARRWSERLCAFHGYGGAAIVESPDSSIASRYEGRCRYFLQRHAGLELDLPLQHALWTKAGIKGANSITVLSSQFLERVGGNARLVSTIGDHCRIEPLSTGGILIAARGLEIGDTYTQTTTPAIEVVSRALAPIRIQIHPSVRRSPAGMDRASFEAWLARFDARS
jgi:hypothetical protein